MPRSSGIAFTPDGSILTAEGQDNSRGGRHDESGHHVKA